jgi:glucose/arabinose dehydrogenase
MVSTEHGPSIFDGPAGGDEINCIEPGRNYGWPIVSHEQSERTMRDPKYIFTPAVAPGSALVYSGDVFPQWKHSLIFGALRGEGVYVVRFVGDGCDDVETVEQLMVDVGRVRTVVEGPDGYIYFTTSNQDSRGEPSGGDDRVMRIVPRK